MIKYALACDACNHHFDGWFSSSDAFDDQSERGLVECPNCNASTVRKQIMAPAVRSRTDAVPPEFARKAAEIASKVRDHVSENFSYVGDKFADEARAIHYGEKDARPVWGSTTKEEAQQLKDEGVPAEPLPAPFVPDVPPDPKKLN